MSAEDLLPKNASPDIPWLSVCMFWLERLGVPSLQRLPFARAVFKNDPDGAKRRFRDSDLPAALVAFELLLMTVYTQEGDREAAWVKRAEDVLKKMRGEGTEVRNTASA